MTDQPTQPEPGEDPLKPDAVPGGAGAWLFGAMIGAVMVALIVAAWIGGKDEGKRQAEKNASTPATRSTPAAAPTAATGPGKQLFAAKCGSCHTLKSAGTKGAVGPNLDDLKPDAALVLSALKNGGAGSGTMPPQLYTGKQAQQVADYVAAASGGG